MRMVTWKDANLFTTVYDTDGAIETKSGSLIKVGTRASNARRTLMFDQTIRGVSVLPFIWPYIVFPAGDPTSL
jgi:hypothetical protein